MFALALAAGPQMAAAGERAALAEPGAARASLDTVVRLLTQGSFTLTDGSGKALGTHRHGDEPPEPVAERTILAALSAAHLTPGQAAAMWSFAADLDNAAMVTLPIVTALAIASDTPKAHGEIWSQLAGMAEVFAHSDPSHMRPQSLLGLCERHRDELLPLLPELRESESSSDDMIKLMRLTRVFGADLDASAARLSARIPAAVARHVERQRHLGRPEPWEYAAFDSMVRWKTARLVPGGANAPRSLAELDAAGEHELYRLGTSGYRGFLHPIIMQGISDSGSFEAFLERALPRGLGEEAARASGRRGMAFMRIASSFGLLEPVLETVRDRKRFIEEAITSLGDARSFEGNSAVVMAVLTQPSRSPAALAFKRALLDQLYERYRTQSSATPLAVYGSMLSVYQTVTGDRRDSAIDRDYPLDASIFRVPFERLFSPGGAGGYAHTMFMRMDEDDDAVESYAVFATLMGSLGATIRHESAYDVFGFASAGRAIAISIRELSHA